MKLSEKLLSRPLALAQYVLDNLGRYEKSYPDMQPEILMGMKAKQLAKLMQKSKNNRGRDEQQAINAWRKWRDDTWKVEGGNETKLRMLFRAMILFNREIGSATDYNTKYKHADCICMICRFLKDSWGISEAFKPASDGTYIALTKKMNVVSGMSSAWRDPISFMGS